MYVHPFEVNRILEKKWNFTSNLHNYGETKFVLVMTMLWQAWVPFFFVNFFPFQHLSSLWIENVLFSVWVLGKLRTEVHKNGDYLTWKWIDEVLDLQTFLEGGSILNQKNHSKMHEGHFYFLRRYLIFLQNLASFEKSNYR